MPRALSAYLGEIGHYQLLTPEQELTLGRKVQALVVLQVRCQDAGGQGPGCEFDVLDHSTMTARERRVVQRSLLKLRSRGVEIGLIEAV